jgi:hypothetical protein
MDVLDEAKIKAVDLDPAISRLRDEILAPVLAAANALLAGVPSERAALFDGAHELLDRLNGTKLLLTSGGIELAIPPRPAPSG